MSDEATMRKPAYQWPASNAAFRRYHLEMKPTVSGTPIASLVSSMEIPAKVNTKAATSAAGEAHRDSRAAMACDTPDR